jgi:hypothetical protein
VDSVVATLDSALAKRGQTLEAIERWKAEMPTEEEMLPRDKYTMFDRKEKKYRKGIHSMGFLWFFSSSGRVKVLTLKTSLQNCQSGREFRRESILLDIKLPGRERYIEYTTNELQCVLAERGLRDEGGKINDEHIRRHISSDLLYIIYHFTLRWSTLDFTGSIEILCGREEKETVSSGCRAQRPIVGILGWWALSLNGALN